ncbi:hypothetical protein Spb1_25540 [Planctopirus ephydatiae]|uniref:Uncharacterized protein n=1 Tax=Planctopirus ephydatiae TaxID=2528019 RepID=A0A518GPS7_9PLAN|nr:hypothetical protein [Planctopirus ephydatiae]QDV30620.1 hypothetical protein Spb1_25540 [Planctopirus ephydatiae]
MNLFNDRTAIIVSSFCLWLLANGLSFTPEAGHKVIGAETIGAEVNPADSQSLVSLPTAETPIAWELSRYRVAWEFRQDDSQPENTTQHSHKAEFEQRILSTSTRISSGLWQSTLHRQRNSQPIAAADVEIVVLWRVEGGGYSAIVTLAQPAYNRLVEFSISRQPDLDALVQAVVRSCLKQFAPELRLATGSSGQLMATHRGELLFPEVATRWSPRNLHLAIPWICYLDEQGKTIRQEPVEWTVLELPSAGAPILHSGSRINLAGRGRSQIELKGLLIPPNDQPTKLSILTLGSRQPQPGLDIFVSHEQLAAATRVQLIQSLRPSNQQKTPTTTENTTEAADSKSSASSQPPRPILVTTNLRGEVLITSQSERDKSRLLWLNVYSGDQLLARVPMIAGAERHVQLLLPDDGPRREAEAQLQSLADEITLIVARRTSLLARLRNASRQRNWQLVSNLRRQIGQLPTDQNVETLISAIQSTSSEAAKKISSRSAAERIRRQSSALLKLAQQHLGTEALKVLDEEIAQLRALDDAAPQTTPKVDAP